MIGLDTSFLVAWAIPEHPLHDTCRALSDQAARAGRQFGLTPGILAEFIHVATDPRRFEKPLSMADALRLAQFWAQAVEVSLLRQDPPATAQWLHWMERYQLGRKRLLDTLIAATWHTAGITEIFTLNPGDFTIFQHFTAYPTAGSA
jgi:predicted nucleic acid-binding protein